MRWLLDCTDELLEYLIFVIVDIGLFAALGIRQNRQYLTGSHGKKVGYC
ncbi:hypothetical protein [Streptococcus suis]